MKKFLFLLLASAAFAACDNDDDNFTPDAGSYNCLLVVTDNTTGNETNRTSNVVCNLEEQSDKSISLTMKNVKFTDSPREPVKPSSFRNSPAATTAERRISRAPERSFRRSTARPTKITGSRTSNAG